MLDPAAAAARPPHECSAAAAAAAATATAAAGTPADVQASSACSTAAMPWQLPEFEQERVERARKLLRESEEHRGSLDLQVGG